MTQDGGLREDDIPTHNKRRTECPAMTCCFMCLSADGPFLSSARSQASAECSNTSVSIAGQRSAWQAAEEERAGLTTRQATRGAHCLQDSPEKIFSTFATSCSICSGGNADSGSFRCPRILMRKERPLLDLTREDTRNAATTSSLGDGLYPNKPELMLAVKQVCSDDVIIASSSTVHNQ